MRKQLYITSLILVLVICFTSSSFAESFSDKTISINVMPKLKPLSFVNDENEPDGFFIKILQLIAKEHNLNIKYHYLSWGEGLDAVKNKKTDLMPCVILTKERQEFLDYSSEIVKTSWGEILLHADSKIESLLDLQNKRIGIMKADQNAANFKKIADDFNLNCTYIEVASQKDIITLLENKTVDGGVFFNTFNPNNPLIKHSTIVFNPVNLYFATAKGTNQKILELISKQLRTWKNDTSSPYYKTLDEFFGETHTFLLPAWIKYTGIGVSILCLFLLCLSISLKYLINIRTKALNKTQKRLKLVMDTTPEGIWDWDVRTGKVYWSEHAYTMLGYKNNEFHMSYKMWQQLTHPEDLSRCEAIVDRALKDNKSFSFEIRYKQKDSSWKWILARGKCVKKDSHGTPFRMVGVHIDIDEQKKTQNILAEKETQLRVIFDKAPSIMLVINNDMQIISLNQAAQKISQTDETEAKGAQAGNIFKCINNNNQTTGCGQHKECQKCDINNAVKTTLKNKKGISNREAAFTMHVNGYTDTKLFLLSTVYLAIEQQPAVLVNLIDITYQKKAEEELIQAKEHAEESDQLKTAFLASLSHEIRTPMNGILGFASLLKEKNLTREEHTDYIKAIETSGDRMLTIINDLVDISKIESNQITLALSPTSANDIMDELHTFFLPQAQAKDIKITAEKSLSDVASITDMDRDKITQVLTNLISNALKFTETGSISFGYTKKENMLEFYVKDTGIGIPPSMQDVVFDRFRQVDSTYTRQHEGSGLGLSISKAFIEKHGGSIWLNSIENKGSCFYFNLPYINKNAKTENKTHKKTALINSNKEIHILIAEDDTLSYILLKELLEKHSIKTSRAVNGEEAVKLAEKNSIDLILMDIKMPKLSGIEATIKIREQNKTLPIIVQSAFNHQHDIQNALQAGCNDFITKPIDSSQLFASINKALHSLDVIQKNK